MKHACFAYVMGLAALAGSPSAQAEGTTFDLAPTGFHITQSIQNGNTTMAAGRSTMVRVAVRALGEIPPGTLYDGILRVFVDGALVETVYSDNGPVPPIVVPELETIDGTLNFIVVPGLSSNVVFECEVNPAGPNQLVEANYSNNIRSSTPQNFQCREDPEIVMVPIDYQFPTVGVVNLPEVDLIKPGIGDGFVQAIFPAPDTHYHRSVANKKIWTSSLSSASGGNSLNQALLADLQLMVPVPDFIYGWAPGALPGYNGVAIGVPGQAAMGNTEPIRHQRTFAHEMGHLFGLNHNTSNSNVVGIDVEHHLNQTEDLPVLKPATQRDIMFAGLLTQEAWIRQVSHDTFWNNASMQCAPEPAIDATTPERLLLIGSHDRATGAVELSTSLVIQGGRSTPFVELSQADLIVQVYEAGELAGELGLSTRSSADSCPTCRGEGEHEHEHGTTDSGDAAPPMGAFGALLPPAFDPDTIERVLFVDAKSGAVVQELARTENAPAVQIAPVATGVDGAVKFSWQAGDADGDRVVSYLRYSHDGEKVMPLATGLTTTSFEIDKSDLPRFEPGQGFVEVLVSDGLQTTVQRIYPSVADGSPLDDGGEGGGANPFGFIYSPDDGKSYPFGANIVLHAHAWDIEAGRLNGANVSWTSDVDGALGVGRLFTYADLSVGTHVVTVTVTDGAGGITSDSSTIEILPRDLPGGGVCQTDLGFGGPGTSELTVCGGDLSSGTTADVALTGAAPSAALWLAVGTSSNPTSLFGGMLVPFPPTITLPAVTDANGDWIVPAGLNGGGGPFTLFLQAAYLDASQPFGIGISNAVQADFLP